MTTMTLTIDDSRQELIEAFKIFVSNFQGVSLQIDRDESKKEILDNFTDALREVHSGYGIQNAKPIADLYQEFANDSR